MLIESSRDLSAMKEVGWIDSQTEHIAVSTVIYTEDRSNPKLKGLKERPLKGPLGLYRDFMIPYKGYIRVI